MALPDEIKQKLLSQQPEPHLHLVRSVVWEGYRWRVLYNRIHQRPLQETFDEFLFCIIKWTFTESWWKAQTAMKADERHIVVKWFYSWANLSKRMMTEENRVAENRWGVLATGEVQALRQLGYDLFCLQSQNKFPDFFVKRLQNYAEFQGARYEIAVAAFCIRSGLQIEFLDETAKTEKHCEFIAKIPQSGMKIGVEAKSRRRKGVLHESGSQEDLEEIKLGIVGLINDAISQQPSGIPYIVFVDVNLPPTPDIPLQDKWWVNLAPEQVEKAMKDDKQRDPWNAIFLTNFAYYYFGNQGDAPKGEWVIAINTVPVVTAPINGVLNEIGERLNEYSDIPQEI